MNIMQLAVETQTCPECGAKPGETCQRIFEAKYVPKWPFNPDPHQKRMDPIRADVWMNGPAAAEKWLDYPMRGQHHADVG